MGRKGKSLLLIVLLILVNALVFPPLVNVISAPPASVTSDPVSTYYEYATTVINGTALNSTDNLDADDEVYYAVGCEAATVAPQTFQPITNGNFTSDASGWSWVKVSGTDVDGAWENTGQSGGSVYIRVWTRNEKGESYWNQNFTLSQANPESVTLNHQWRCGFFDTVDSCTIKLQIAHPNGTVFDVWTQTVTGTTAWSGILSISVNTGIFDQTGTYQIRLWDYTDLGKSSSTETKVYYDDVALTLQFPASAIYEVNVEHTSGQVAESIANITQIFFEDNLKFNVTVTASLEWFNWTANAWANINSGTVGPTEVTWDKTWASGFGDVINSTGYMKVRIYTAVESNAHCLLEDYLHWDVTYLVPDTTPPEWSNAGTNNTLAGQPTLFHVKWTDNVGLSGFIFGTNNTGTWTNDTWTPMGGTADWSNVTKTLNSTVGVVVQWRVWANDTSNNWNDTGILSLTTYPLPTVSVTPSNITGPPPNINDTFNVTVTINYVHDLYAWQAGMAFNASVLQAVNFTEGPFLKDWAQTHGAPNGTLWVAGTINNTAGVISYHGCALTGYIPGANGTGTLGTIAFNVTNGGNSTLHLTDVILLDSNLTEMPRFVTDGYFSLPLVPKPPVASFTFSPATPTVGETVTFDASASTPNGGAITGYTWDFDDGNVTGPVTNPIITHVYAAAGNYNVTLNVTDSQGYWDTTWKIVPVVEGYDLNLRILDWDLTDPVQGAYVYKDADVKVSDANGWANWTALTGTVYIKVKYYGAWVNGTSVAMDSDKTIDVRCNIFDIEVTCVEGLQSAFLQHVNVTVYNATGVAGSMIRTGITGTNGKVSLTNVPNATLTFTCYDGASPQHVIADVTRTITAENQTETIICDQNCILTTHEWGIIGSRSSALYLGFILLLGFAGKPSRMLNCLKERIKKVRSKQNKKRKGGRKNI